MGKQQNLPKKPTDPQVVQGEEESPELTFWYNYMLQLKQEEIKRIEEAAKFLAALISIVFTLFQTAAKSKISTTNEWFALFVWSLPIGFSLFVIVPSKFKYSPDYIEGIESLHEEILWRKKTFLLLSIISFFIGIILNCFVLNQEIRENDKIKPELEEYMLLIEKDTTPAKFDTIKVKKLFKSN